MREVAGESRSDGRPSPFREPYLVSPADALYERVVVKRISQLRCRGSCEVIEPIRFLVVYIDNNRAFGIQSYAIRSAASRHRSKLLEAVLDQRARVPMRGG